LVLSPIDGAIIWDFILAQRRRVAPATGSAPPLQVEVCRYPPTSTRGG
jgi:hypothetical protein